MFDHLRLFPKSGQRQLKRLKNIGLPDVAGWPCNGRASQLTAQMQLRDHKTAICNATVIREVERHVSYTAVTVNCRYKTNCDSRQTHFDATALSSASNTGQGRR